MDEDRTAIVLAGGDPVAPGLARTLPDPALVVAADSGLDQARILGLAVDVVVGDMDSVDPDELAAIAAAGAEIIRHPADKDATDLELALEVVRARRLRSALVVGGGGGRLDHFLGNALLLASQPFAGLDLEWWIGGYRVIAVRDRVELEGTIGDIVTLLPLGGPAAGVVTEGLRWPLDGAILQPGSTRGLSNELDAAGAVVSVRSGVLLVMHERGRP